MKTSTKRESAQQAARRVQTKNVKMAKAVLRALEAKTSKDANWGDVGEAGYVDELLTQLLGAI